MTVQSNSNQGEGKSGLGLLLVSLRLGKLGSLLLLLMASQWLNAQTVNTR